MNPFIYVRECRKEEREKLIDDSLIKPKRNPMLYVMKEKVKPAACIVRNKTKVLWFHQITKHQNSNPIF